MSLLFAFACFVAIYETPPQIPRLTKLYISISVSNSNVTPVFFKAACQVIDAAET